MENPPNHSTPAQLLIAALGESASSAAALCNRLAKAGFPAVPAALDSLGLTAAALDVDIVVADTPLADPRLARVLPAPERDPPAVVVALQQPPGTPLPGPPSPVSVLAAAGQPLKETLQLATTLANLQRAMASLRQQVRNARLAGDFIAQSGAGRELLDLVRRVARAGATAVVEGESGTGKELVARLLHHWSERAAGPFVAVNCKAFAEGVLESELFGHERGAFTGAIAARAGCFERASGGTLFLDEIAEAGLDFQAKLLRVLEEREVLRVGGSRPHRVDVRLIAATNRVLRREVEGGRFREDLFFRLNVINLRITPLRERVEDILPLARHFLALNAADPQRLPGFSPEAEALLVSYPWPGNVRELQNAVERALVLNDSGLLTPRDFDLPSHAPTLPSQAAPPPAALSTETLQQHLDRAAAAHIKAALTAARGNRALAASLLNVDRSTLYRLIKKLKL
ncbi:MAG: sigma-54 dependent transcriptional regulator [Deltaproteobacteria bacterium]|nr:sigma-54 dependent transcriptional regulator [Deltaproteobacteria bacterium]